MKAKDLFLRVGVIALTEQQEGIPSNSKEVVE